MVTGVPSLPYLAPLSSFLSSVLECEQVAIESTTHVQKEALAQIYAHLPSSSEGVTYHIIERVKLYLWPCHRCVDSSSSCVRHYSVFVFACLVHATHGGDPAGRIKQRTLQVFDAPFVELDSMSVALWRWLPILIEKRWLK